MNSVDDVRTKVQLHHYYRMMDSRYSELWDSYVQSEPMEGSSDAHFKAHLSRWALWADQPTLSADDKTLCLGPRERLEGVFHRDLINGISFASQQVDQNRKAKDSWIIQPREGGKIEVGRVQRFITHRGPGSASSDLHSRIVDVKWLGTPADGSDWNKKINCPLVLRSYRTDSRPLYIDFGSLIPTKVILVHQGTRHYRVLHVDSYLCQAMCPVAPCPYRMTD